LSEASEREGAFRFLGNERNSLGAIAKCSHEAALKRCSGEDFFFVPVDQTSLSLTDTTGTKGFGRVGTGQSHRVRGLQVMSALAVSRDGRVQGICGQKWWCRPEEPIHQGTRDDRSADERESSLWTSVIGDVELTSRRMGCNARAWYQLDRGGDTLHVLQKAATERLLLTTRSAHDRRVIDADGERRALRETVAAQRVLFGVNHWLSPNAAKRLGHSWRRARHLVVRACAVEIELRDWSTGHGRLVGTAPLWVVHARERRPPRGCKRLDWLLLTTYPVHTPEDALLVIQGYTTRWRIEDFHRTWKSGGCNVERSQLRNAETFKRWATLLAAVASRIEHLKYVARNQPDRPALEIATREEIDAAILQSHTKKWKYGATMTAQQFVELVAQAGGYTGKSSGGPPGSITIGRGLDRVLATAAGIAAARKM
jgi:hypothetical protein